LSIWLLRVVEAAAVQQILSMLVAVVLVGI
jgi:hypothetical protein